MASPGSGRVIVSPVGSPASASLSLTSSGSAKLRSLGPLHISVDAGRRADLLSTPAGDESQDNTTGSKSSTDSLPRRQFRARSESVGSPLPSGPMAAARLALTPGGREWLAWRGKSSDAKANTPKARQRLASPRMVPLHPTALRHASSGAPVLRSVADAGHVSPPEPMSAPVQPRPRMRRRGSLPSSFTAPKTPGFTGPSPISLRRRKSLTISVGSSRVLDAWAGDTLTSPLSSRASPRHSQARQFWQRKGASPVAEAVSPPRPDSDRALGMGSPPRAKLFGRTSDASERVTSRRVKRLPMEAGHSTSLKKRVVADYLKPKSVLSFRTVFPYVPSCVLNFAIKTNGVVSAPVARRTTSASLFVDVSGFTLLTERLAVWESHQGAEAMSTILDGYFSSMVDIIHGHGGDVIKFAGDALLVVWSDHTHLRSAVTLEQHPDEKQSMRVLRAAQCALQLHAECSDVEVMEGVFLRIHSAVGAGDILGVHVGGHGDRWEYLIEEAKGSSALSGLWLAMGQAKVGEIVLSPEALACVKGHLETDAQGCTRGCERLTGIIPDHKLEPIDLVRVPTLSLSRNHLFGRNAAAHMTTYVPRLVADRLQMGQDGWLAENRHATVLFVKLPEHDVNSHSGLMEFQKMVTTAQECCASFQGILRQLITDDKGTVMIFAFGLTSTTRTALRGVHAAFRMQRLFTLMAKTISVGITTGPVFCGALGHVFRKEFVLIGDVVNTSARLMGLVHKLHISKGTRIGVLCDGATKNEIQRNEEERAGSSRTVFIEMGSVPLKGKEEEIPVFQPKEVVQVLSRSYKEKMTVRALKLVDEPVIVRKPQRGLIERVLRHACLAPGAFPVSRSVLFESRHSKVRRFRDSDEKRALPTSAQSKTHLAVTEAPGRVRNAKPPSPAKTGAPEVGSKPKSPNGREREPHCILIEGESHMGKDELALWSFDLCQKLGICVLGGRGDVLERRSPFFGYSTVVYDLLKTLLICPEDEVVKSPVSVLSEQTRAPILYGALSRDSSMERLQPPSPISPRPVMPISSSTHDLLSRKLLDIAGSSASDGPSGSDGGFASLNLSAITKDDITLLDTMSISDVSELGVGILHDDPRTWARDVLCEFFDVKVPFARMEDPDWPMERELQIFLPLLNGIVPGLVFPETKETTELFTIGSQSRERAIGEFIVRLIELVAKRHDDANRRHLHPSGARSGLSTESLGGFSPLTADSASTARRSTNLSVDMSPTKNQSLDLSPASVQTQDRAMWTPDSGSRKKRGVQSVDFAHTMRSLSLRDTQATHFKLVLMMEDFQLMDRLSQDLTLLILKREPDMVLPVVTFQPNRETNALPFRRSLDLKVAGEVSSSPAGHPPASPAFRGTERHERLLSMRQKRFSFSPISPGSSTRERRARSGSGNVSGHTASPDHQRRPRSALVKGRSPIRQRYRVSSKSSDRGQSKVVPRVTREVKESSNRQIDKSPGIFSRRFLKGLSLSTTHYRLLHTGALSPTLHVVTRALTQQDVNSRVCQLMEPRASQVNQFASRVLYHLSEGHPFYLRELVARLSAAGDLNVVNGSVELSARLQTECSQPETPIRGLGLTLRRRPAQLRKPVALDIESNRRQHDRGASSSWNASVSRAVELLEGSLESVDASVPDSVKELIGGVIDALDPALQMLVKVCSVFGRVIPVRVLYEVYPVREDKTWLRGIREHFNSLSDSGLLVQYFPDHNRAASRGGLFCFRHRLMQLVAYARLPFSYRAELHLIIAQWYQQTFALSDVSVTERKVLAFHWYKAAEDNQNDSRLYVEYLMNSQKSLQGVVEATDRTPRRSGPVPFLREAKDEWLGFGLSLPL